MSQSSDTTRYGSWYPFAHLRSHEVFLFGHEDAERKVKLPFDSNHAVCCYRLLYARPGDPLLRIAIPETRRCFVPVPHCSRCGDLGYTSDGVEVNVCHACHLFMEGDTCDIEQLLRHVGMDYPGRVQYSRPRRRRQSAATEPRPRRNRESRETRTPSPPPVRERRIDL